MTDHDRKRAAEAPTGSEGARRSTAIVRDHGTWSSAVGGEDRAGGGVSRVSAHGGDSLRAPSTFATVALDGGGRIRRSTRPGAAVAAMSERRIRRGTVGHATSPPVREGGRVRRSARPANDVEADGRGAAAASPADGRIRRKAVSNDEPDAPRVRVSRSAGHDGTIRRMNVAWAGIYQARHPLTPEAWQAARLAQDFAGADTIVQAIQGQPATVLSVFETLYPSIVGPAEAANLVALITGIAATAADAPHIQAVLVLMNGLPVPTTGLLTAAGHAHLALVAPMLTNAGGHAQAANLTAIMNRHPGAGNLAAALAAEAGGNAATFARLAGEVPMFLRTAAPGGIPAATTAARTSYNLAVLAPLHTQLTTVAAQMAAIHAAAQAAAPAGAGIAAGLLNTIQIRANNIAGYAAAVAPPSVTNAVFTNQARQQVIGVPNLLNNQTVTAAGVAVPAIAAAVPLANAAAAQAIVDLDTPLISDIGFDHFLERHTAHYFDFGGIIADNTQWPTAWGAATLANLDARVAHLINGLVLGGLWITHAAPHVNRPTGVGGETAQIAGLLEDAADWRNIRVGQVFPEANPAAFIWDHPMSTMQAINQVL